MSSCLHFLDLKCHFSVGFRKSSHYCFALSLPTKLDPRKQNVNPPADMNYSEDFPYVAMVLAA